MSTMPGGICYFLLGTKEAGTRSDLRARHLIPEPTFIFCGHGITTQPWPDLSPRTRSRVFLAFHIRRTVSPMQTIIRCDSQTRVAVRLSRAPGIILVLRFHLL